MTNDPFQPPNTHQNASPANLETLGILGIVSVIQGFALSVCCGILGVVVAWILPVVCIVWGILVWMSPDSPPQVKQQGLRGAALGGLGLAAIPLGFGCTVCIGAALGFTSALVGG